MLKVRDLGALPGELDASINFSIDATVPYLNANRETLSDTVLAGAVITGGNPFATLIVPTGQIWYVHEFAVISVLGAGAACTYATGLIVPGGLNVVTGAFDAGGANQIVAAFAERGYWALSGYQFTFLAKAATVPSNVTGVLLATRLRA